ncbi:DNA-binding protein [Bacteroidia bacterium]|nr:DNA-binding protein [Bacteroidia bacterium]
MFDFDLAEAYGVKTKRLKEQVRRNIERFPEDFMFELTKKEWLELVAICDRLPANMKHSTVAPFVFTQEGIAMLSGILNSPLAIQMNICIMRAFVVVRQFLSIPPAERLAVLEHEVKRLTANIEDAFADYNDINEETRMQLEAINNSLAELQAHNRIPAKPHKVIGFTADRSVPAAADSY